MTVFYRYTSKSVQRFSENMVTPNPRKTENNNRLLKETSANLEIPRKENSMNTDSSVIVTSSPLQPLAYSLTFFTDHD